MNLTNRKLLIVSALIFLLATILGGWFVFRDKKTPEGGQGKPVAGEDTTQKPKDVKPSSVDTSDWKTYRNEEYGFELKYPEGCSYGTEDFSDTIHDGSIRGEVVSFLSSNEECPPVKTFSKKLSSQDSRMQKTIDVVRFEGRLKISGYGFGYNKYEVVNEIAKNIYQIIGYSNVECSSIISAQLVYVFPENSSWDYASVFLGARTGFDNDDFLEQCLLKESVYKKEIQDIVSGKDVNINAKKDRGIVFLESFRNL